MSKYFSGRTAVEVEYVGNEPISNVTLIVTGQQYVLGTLNPHATVALNVWLTNDSHLEIMFHDSAGQKKLLNAGGYFGPSMAARIKTRFDSTSIISTDFSYN